MDQWVAPATPLAFVHQDDREEARGWLEWCGFPSVSRFDDLERTVGGAQRPIVLAFVPASATAVDRVTQLVHREAPVIAVVDRPLPELAISLLEVGAEDVVSTTTSRGELLARAAAVVRRSRGWTPAFVASDLRRAEFNLLTYLLRNAGRVVPQRELVREVFGGAHTCDTPLVRVHVTHLRKKLGSRANAIKTVRGRGYAVDAAALLSSEPVARLGAGGKKVAAL